jgi:hypothetical protein
MRTRRMCATGQGVDLRCDIFGRADVARVRPAGGRAGADGFDEREVDQDRLEVVSQHDVVALPTRPGLITWEGGRGGGG